VSIGLEREQDPEVLRQAARLLEAENRRLVARVTELTKALLAAQGTDRVALQMEIESFQAQLETLQPELGASRIGRGGRCPTQGCAEGALAARPEAATDHHRGALAR
jgi:transposase